MKTKVNLHFYRKKGTIPSRTRRKIEYAIRTAYTAAACLLLMRAWRWAGPVTYISAVLSGTTAVMYLGQWQKNIWKVFYSCVAGGIGGMIVGSAWQYKVLHTLLLFVALLWINKCSVWDQLPKVIAGVSLALVALWPVLTNGELSGILAFVTVFLVVLMPNIITGATLLLPFPKLALPSCQRIIVNICDKMTWLLEQHIAAFCHADYADLHMFRVDALSRDVTALLDVLPTLVTYVAAESILLPPLRSFPRRTEIFMGVCREMLEELASMRDIHRDILLQTVTHERFSTELRGPLMLMIEECKSVLALVKRRLVEYRADGNQQTTTANATRGEYMVNDLEVDGEALDDIFSRIEDASCAVLSATHRCREKYVFLNSVFDSSKVAEPQLSSHLRESATPTSPGQTDVFCGDVQSADDKFVIDVSGHSSSARETDVATLGELPDGNGSPIRVRRAWSQASSLYWEPQLRIKIDEGAARRRGTLTSDSPRSTAAEGEETLTENQKELYQENLRYGTKNLNPRGAYLCRLMRCVHLTNKFRAVLDEVVSAPSNSLSHGAPHHPRPSIAAWILRGAEGALAQAASAIIAGAHYLLACLYEPYRLLCVCACGSRDVLLHECKSYATAFKIALVGMLLSLLVIDDDLRAQYPYGIWAMLVVMIVRQENAASSFTSGYQRIEGTVIGCVFAYVYYEAFGCMGNCNYGSVTTGLVLWIACCAYFREGAKHGYAALVAGITPMILLVGRNRNSALAPWARVQMTIVGVGVYLLVDNLVLPRRSDSTVRSLVLDCARHARSQLADSMKALEKLLGHRHTHGELDPLSKPATQTLSDIEVALALQADSPIDLYLRSATLANDRYKSAITRLYSNLELAGNEPELWRRPFPLAEYTSLARALQRAHLSGGAVIRALRGLCNALNKMQPEHAAKTFSLLTHLSSHMIKVSTLADQALQQAEEALNRLYSNNRTNMHLDDDDLTSAVVLNRNCEELLREVDQHFRTYYMSHVCVRINSDDEAIIKRNEEMRLHRQLPGYPEFMVNWQDLFGSTCQHMRDLSQLGNEMQNTRNAEAIV